MVSSWNASTVAINVCTELSGASKVRLGQHIARTSAYSRGRPWIVRTCHQDTLASQTLEHKRNTDFTDLQWCIIAVINKFEYYIRIPLHVIDPCQSIYQQARQEVIWSRDHCQSIGTELSVTIVLTPSTFSGLAVNFRPKKKSRGSNLVISCLGWIPVRSAEDNE